MDHSLPWAFFTPVKYAVCTAIVTHKLLNQMVIGGFCDKFISFTKAGDVVDHKFCTLVLCTHTNVVRPRWPGTSNPARPEFSKLTLILPFCIRGGFFRIPCAAQLFCTKAVVVFCSWVSHTVRTSLVPGKAWKRFLFTTKVGQRILMCLRISLKSCR